MKSLILNIIFIFSTAISFAQSGWFVQSSNVNDSLRSVRFINAQTGYTAGSNGRILKTTDSGNNWIPLNLNTSIDLLSIFTFSDNFVCCCGDSGLILISSNAGLSWTSANVTFLKLRSVFFTDSLNGHITGDSGLILKTTNSGISWMNYFYSSPIQFNSVCFADSIHGWIAGYGAILYTADNGLNWINQFVDGKLILNSVFFKDYLHGWTGYYDNSTFGPEILRTSSGGNDWRSYSAGNNSYSLSLFFTDTLNGWSSGYYGNIVRTSNGGLNWINQISGTDKHLFSVFFINSSTGWITGEDGIILKTTTGGIITGIGNNYQYSPDEVLSISNYPNPFNSSTSIKFKIPSDKINSDNSVELKVYDALGNEIYFRIYKLSSLNSENNYYKLIYDASGFASGMYFYKIKFNGYSSVKKMILLK
ncbi:MAG: T9SS type A sorting domain-containing protein [Ignavibacteria bacterium]|nr:T9SS type A sorting domain-containing protein [Ignavibacteria bacterium]